jgi:hypothetical protein
LGGALGEGAAGRPEPRSSARAVGRGGETAGTGAGTGVALQLHYTVGKNGYEGAGGFQFVAVTPGVTGEDLRTIRPAVHYDSPPSGGESWDEPADFRYQTLRNGAAIAWLARPIDVDDASARPGNFFAHVLYLRDGTLPTCAGEGAGEDAGGGEDAGSGEDSVGERATARSPSNCGTRHAGHPARSRRPTCRRSTASSRGGRGCANGSGRWSRNGKTTWRSSSTACAGCSTIAAAGDC